MNKDNLIIVSVPFVRNARVFLSSQIFKKLSEHEDILIVSPFSDKLNFREEFGGPNVSFLTVKSEPQAKGMLLRLYHLSEYLRINGYWFRFRKDKMEYYWQIATSLKMDATSSRYIKISFKEKLVAHLTGRIGYFKSAWKFIDRLLGRFLYDTSPIEQFSSKYKNVLLIQVANFGYQDKFLGYCAKKFSLKSIFIPYTTDQLSVDGYLINNFHKVCTQGPEETRYAVDYHNIPSERICKLGMLWFRNLEAMNENSIAIEGNKRDKFILYAGISSAYFPKANELEAIDDLLRAIKSGFLPKAKLIYRPVANKDEIDFIFNKFRNEELMEIQIPKPALIGMFEYTESSIKSEVLEYLDLMRSIDLLIMSATTSILFEALYFDKPAISYFYDSNSELAKAGYIDLLIRDGVPPGVPIVSNSASGLVDKIREILNGHSLYPDIKQKVLGAWDYRNDNYLPEFTNLVDTLKR